MLLQTIELPKEKYGDIAFHSKSQLFALNSSQKILIRDIDGNQKINTFEASKYYFSKIAFSNDARHFITVDSHELITLYELDDFKKILSFSHENVFDVAVNSKLGLIAISNSENNRIKLWDINLNVETCIFEDYKNSKSNVSFSPDGNILALGDYYSGTVGLIDVATMNLTYLLKEIHSNGDLVFSPNGQIIAGESYHRDAVILFEANSGKLLQILEDKKNFHDSEITCIAFSSDNKLVASGSYDLTIRIWNVSTGKQIKIFKGHETTIFNVLFTNSDQTLISASADCTIRFWQI